MSVVTSYLEEDVRDTLCGAPLTRYRTVHWLCDILRNFFSDPANIPDERLARLLRLQDGIGNDETRALFQVGLPWSKDSRKACTTPAILVSGGATSYPLQTLNVLPGTALPSGARTASSGRELRVLTLKVAVLTESHDGTLLLTDVLEDFLVMNGVNLAMDNGALSQFSVKGASEIQEIRAGEGMNAKEIYQSVIGCEAVGGLAWESDTQGPVFRGMQYAQKQP